MPEAKLLFAGTPDFARASLSAVVEAGFDVAAVLTQPDRPAGRGRKLTPGPVRQFAESRGIDVLQPVTLKDPDVIGRLAAMAPDLMIVAAYGLLLPRAALDVPRLGCVNVHASILPRWRGAAPIQHAILAGDRETGISLMQMDAGLDTGPVYATRAIEIGADETAGHLHDRLARLGGLALVEALPALLHGRLSAEPQDDSLATYAAKIRRRDAELDWHKPAAALAAAVRAYNPVPGAWFRLDGEDVKCWQASVLPSLDEPPGVIAAAGPDGVDVACGDGALRLVEVQRPGRRRVTGAEFGAGLAGKRLT